MNARDPRNRGKGTSLQPQGLINRNGIQPVRSVNTPPLGTGTPKVKPAVPMTTPVMERKSHEMLRKNNEEYRMRQAAKNALALSQSTSYGYYISKPSKFDNTLIPAIPRRKA